MGIIDLAELAGATTSFSPDNTNNTIICAECLTDKELAGLTDDQIIANAEIENADTKAYFCDRCKELI